MINIAINGLGRIGRLIFRAAMADPEINIKLVNSPADLETLAHLINYDSIHGRADFTCIAKDGKLVIGEKEIIVSNQRDPALIPAQGLAIDIMLECTGKFTKKSAAAAHLTNGSKKVIVSAPCEEADATIVMGVNHHVLEDVHEVISIGSCTTNALAPVAKVLNNNFGIEYGYVTTIHAYTGDQNIVDNSHSDLRRARAAGMSMVPTKTGAAKALKLVLPELEGKLAGSAVRVPTANVSLIDLVFTAAKETSVEEVNKAIKVASELEMKNILGIAPTKLVSIDFNHTSYSSIFDPFETSVIGSKLVRVVSWYDNEWAFALRMLDAAKLFKKVS